MKNTNVIEAILGSDDSDVDRHEFDQTVAVPDAEAFQAWLETDADVDAATAEFAQALAKAMNYRQDVLRDNAKYIGQVIGDATANYLYHNYR